MPALELRSSPLTAPTTVQTRKKARWADRSFQPMQETLSRMSGLGLVSGVRFGMDGREGWVGSARLFSGDARPLRKLIGLAGAGGGSSDAGLMADFFDAYARRVTLTGLAFLMCEKRAPMLRTDNCALIAREGAPGEMAILGPGMAGLPSDPDAGHATVRIVDSMDSLREFMVYQIYDRHLRQVINSLARQRVLPRRTLRAMALEISDRSVEELGQQMGMPERDIECEKARLQGLYAARRDLASIAGEMARPRSVNALARVSVPA